MSDDKKKKPVKMASGNDEPYPKCGRCWGAGEVLEGGKKYRCPQCNGTGIG